MSYSHQGPGDAIGGVLFGVCLCGRAFISANLYIKKEERGGLLILLLLLFAILLSEKSTSF